MDGGFNSADYGTGVAVDREDNVFITGYSVRPESSRMDFVTIKYRSWVPIPLSVQRRNDEFVLTWTNSAFSLQSAPTVTGAFSDTPGATSPHTNRAVGTGGYFRLISR